MLDRQSVDDAQVLVLHGQVDAGDVDDLRTAVVDALAASTRGVVVDLTDAPDVAGAAVDVLGAVAADCGSWPRPAMTVCGAPPSAWPALAGLVRLHDDRQIALAHLDDGVGDVREVAVEHGPHGPRQARTAVEQWARDTGLGDLTDELLLIVSELVTNAVRYGAPPVRVSITADSRSVTVGVVDASGVLPVARAADADAESGRGLLLLSLLSAEHGVRPQPPGKVVWVSLPRLSEGAAT